MGTPAWQKRDSERQEIVEEVHRIIEDWADERHGGDSVYVYILRFANSFLELVISKEDTVASWSEIYSFEVSSVRSASERIDHLARTPEEAKVLKIRLIEKLLESGFRQMRNELNHQEVHE